MFNESVIYGLLKLNELYFKFSYTMYENIPYTDRYVIKTPVIPFLRLKPFDLILLKPYFFISG